MFPTKHCLEKNNKKDRPPCSQKRYDGPMLLLFMRVLVLIAGVHWSTLDFAVAGSTVF